MLFQTTFEKNPVTEASKELVFVLSQRKIRCAAISFFRGRQKWPQASKVLEKTTGARGRATGVAFLCIGARDPGIWAILEAFGGSRDSQETPGML